MFQHQSAGSRSLFWSAYPEIRCPQSSDLLGTRFGPTSQLVTGKISRPVIACKVIARISIEFFTKSKPVSTGIDGRFLLTPADKCIAFSGPFQQSIFCRSYGESHQSLYDYPQGDSARTLEARRHRSCRRARVAGLVWLWRRFWRHFNRFTHPTGLRKIERYRSRGHPDPGKPFFRSLHRKLSRGPGVFRSKCSISTT